MPLAAITLVGRHDPATLPDLKKLLAAHGLAVAQLHHQVLEQSFVLDLAFDLPASARLGETFQDDLAGLARRCDARLGLVLPNSHPRPRLAILVSKEPHGLEQLLAGQKSGRLGGRIACVLSNHAALAPLAVAAGAPFFHHPSEDKAAHHRWLDARLREEAVGLVVLARYMQIVPGEIVREYQGRMVNVHPTLLPHFPGAAPYREAWAAGLRIMGVTAHFVTEVLDEGPIILQDTFEIDVGRDSPEEIKRRGQGLEARALARAVEMFLDGQLALVGGKVLRRPGMRAMGVRGEISDF